MIELLNKKEAMEYIGVGEWKFNKLIREKEITKYKYKGSRGLQKRYAIDNLDVIKEKYVKNKTKKMLQKP
ncbi:MAG TPA: hypothetical protein VMZ91_03575 [Candidatus Paceibacterota bacterium]|nr:hypothetical protein [Candidatus Paceibacterota bacterium]